jgi:hypothetical protein
MFKTIAAATLMLAAMPATAATFDFSGGDSSNGTYGNARVFTAGGISVRASAWQATPTSGGYTVTSAYLARFSAGLGVTGSGDYDGFYNLHTIDNQGKYDFVLLQFDRTVRLDGATLNPFSVSGSTDNDAFISAGVTNLAWTSTINLASQTALATGLFNNGASIKSGAGTPAVRSFGSYAQAGNIWIVGADFFNRDGVDGFKLDDLVVSPAVPEPAAWAMMIGGFGLVGATMRRRRSPLVQYA